MSKKFDTTISTRYTKEGKMKLDAVCGDELSNQTRLFYDSICENEKIDYNLTLIEYEIKKNDSSIQTYKNYIQDYVKIIKDIENKNKELLKKKNLMLKIRQSNNEISSFNNSFKDIILAYNKGILKEKCLDYLPKLDEYHTFYNKLEMYLSNNLNKKFEGVLLEEKSIVSILDIIKEVMLL